MRMSRLFGRTLREVPSGTEVAGHGLLLRAGFVRQLAAGIFSYLPLAKRSLDKVSGILREEVEACGGQEVSMPVVHPAEIWERSGRYGGTGAELVRLRDRRDRDGERKPVALGSYGIGRLLACIAEENRDENGLVWPIFVAPYTVHLVSTNDELTTSLYEELRSAGVEVLYDDRKESLGTKFKDADLIGTPIRLTLTPRSLDSGGVEVKLRRDANSGIVPLEEVVATLTKTISDLKDEIPGGLPESTKVP